MNDTEKNDKRIVSYDPVTGRVTLMVGEKTVFSKDGYQPAEIIKPEEDVFMVEGVSYTVKEQDSPSEITIIAPERTYSIPTSHYRDGPPFDYYMTQTTSSDGNSVSEAELKRLMKVIRAYIKKAEFVNTRILTSLDD